MVGSRRRVALVVEILAAYARARRVLSRPLPEAAASQRRVSATVAPRFPQPLREGARLGHATLRVLRVLPMDKRCLVRSLTLTRLLARRGITSTLVIGVKRDPEFGAHAWVELEGAPLLPSGGEAFTRLTEL